MRPVSGGAAISGSAVYRGPAPKKEVELLAADPLWWAEEREGHEGSDERAQEMVGDADAEFWHLYGLDGVVGAEW